MTTPLYRHFDQAGLDAELNLRERWPDFEDYFRRWADESRAVRDSRPCRLDLAYGDSAGERLDLFVPTGASKPPLLVFIHGGYWQALDKGDFSYLAPAFVDAGIAYVSLNYDLAPAAPVERMVEQIYRALSWLYRSAAELGYDRQKLFVAGHSAGGHLAAMTLIEAWPETHSVPSDLVKGVCAVSGVYDLTPIQLSYQQDVVKLDPAIVPRISPLTLTPSAKAPLICAVGDGETDEFLTQQGELATAWRSAGQAVEEIVLCGRNHFSAVDALGERDHLLFTAARDMILLDS